MKNLIPGFLIITLLMGVLKLPGQDVVMLLPSSSEMTGWAINSEPDVYIGDNLYELIDGGADIYLEYGFIQVVSAHYTDPSLNNIQVEIYEMTDAPSAYGIFSITQQTADWSKQYGNLSAVKEDYISFWKSKYYVNLSWSSRQHLDKPLLARLANMIVQKIPEAGDYPAIIHSFQAMDPGKKAVYLKGNLALSNFYYFDYKDIFKIQNAIACSPGGHHKIVIKYADHAKAIETLAGAKQSILINKRFTDVAMAYQGFSCRDNKGNYILFRQIENYLAILVALNDNISLVPIMDEITLKIENAE
jgi:hypothetical protein